MKKIINSVILVLVFAVPALAGHLHLEKEYQAAWSAAHGGETEYVLEDKARVDILTDEYAIEVDFAPKWAESVGQAFYYAECTKRKPGVVLIMEGEDDGRYLHRLQVVADKYGIKVWTMTPSDLKVNAR